MLDKIDEFLYYVVAPVAFFYAITMSVLTKDIIALTISIIGTIACMSLVVKLAIKR